MNIKLGLVNIFMSLVNTIGTILVFLGFFVFFNSGSSTLLFIGLLLILLSEAANIYTLKYEEKRKIENMKDDLLKNVGSSFAWPVLLFVLYILSSNKAILSFSFIITITATIKVISLIIKVYMIDNNSV